MRIVQKFKGSEKIARVCWDNTRQEYIVKVYSLDGLRLPDEDYFTDDKNDALQTARIIAGSQKN